MNNQSTLSGRFGIRHTALAAAMLMGLFAIVPLVTSADQRTATPTVSTPGNVSLSDLHLSTPEGMRIARDRLHTMAEQLCGHRPGGGELSSRPAFSVCVDSTVANALRHIATLRRTHTTVVDSVTLGAGVSLADLDLSTLEGAHIARQRLEATARRLCGELSRRQDLGYPPNYAACVHDTLAGALAQADVLAASRNTRTARRSAPQRGSQGAVH